LFWRYEFPENNMARTLVTEASRNK